MCSVSCKVLGFAFEEFAILLNWMAFTKSHEDIIADCFDDFIFEGRNAFVCKDTMSTLNSH